MTTTEARRPIADEIISSGLTMSFACRHAGVRYRHVVEGTENADERARIERVIAAVASGDLRVPTRGRSRGGP